MDRTTVDGSLIYTHCGLDTNNVLTVKLISINLNTLGWTLSTSKPNTVPTIALTQAEYDALTTYENALYVITEA